MDREQLVMETEAITAEAGQGQEMDGNVSDGVEESRCDSMMVLPPKPEEVEGGDDEGQGNDEMKVEENLAEKVDEGVHLNGQVEDNAVDGVKEEDGQESRLLRLSNDGAMIMEFLMDQGKEVNFTDLDLICIDGYIQVHRCVLMGASPFFMDLLIDKDIRDTTAITLQDVSVHHLQLVLSLLYTGRTVIKNCDEVEVSHAMTMLGLPRENFMSRLANETDAARVTVLRHISEDSPVRSEAKEGEGEDDTDKSLEDAKSKNGTEDDESLENDGSMEVEDQEKEQQLPTTDSSVKSDKDDRLPMITSTTSDTDSIKDYTPLSQKDSLLNNNQYKPKACNKDTVELVVEHNQKHSTDDKASKENVITNPESNATFDAQSLNGSQSQSNNTAHSMSSDLFEDLNFEEACDDLQKQIAMPFVTSASISNGYDITLRKRKLSDNQENTKTIIDDDPPVRKTRSGAIPNEPKPKKKRGKRGRKPTVINNNSEGEGDALETDKHKETKTATGGARKSRNKSIESMSSAKTGKSNPTSQRKLSTCSSTTDSTNGLANRVFLEVKEFNGEKYNIYGLVDPVKGIQSGKTIAIMAKADKVKNSQAKN